MPKKSNLQKEEREKLERRFKFITRWIFGCVLINLRSTKCIWWQKDLHKFKIRNWEFELEEANMGSLQLICAAIETYGRIMLDYKDKDKDGVSKESFVAFIHKFFPKKYQDKENDIYSHYRCGLLHNNILNYNSSKGFFPTRGTNRQYWDKHLWFTNSQNNSISAIKNDHHQRLIINIDTLFKDFKKAVENLIDNALNNKKIENFKIKIGENKQEKTIKIKSIKQNAENSLKDIPEDY